MDEQTAANIIRFAWKARNGILVMTQPCSNNGCHQGTIKPTFNNIREKLGEPTFYNQDKSTVEWNVSAYVPNWKTHKFEVASFAIYDWKETQTPTGMHEWHVGGKNKQAIEVARQLLTHQ